MEAVVTKKRKIRDERNKLIRADFEKMMSVEGTMPTAVYEALGQKYGLGATSIIYIVKHDGKREPKSES